MHQQTLSNRMKTQSLILSNYLDLEAKELNLFLRPKRQSPQSDARVCGGSRISRMVFRRLVVLRARRNSNDLSN